MSEATPGAYYVPHGTRWPILGSFGLFFTVGGAALWMNEVRSAGKIPDVAIGIAMILSMMLSAGSAAVIAESLAGTYNKQVDTSFRMGMMWFIFSEVMFFAAFFGALFYARTMSVRVDRRRRRRRAHQLFPMERLCAGMADERPGQCRRCVRIAWARGAFRSSTR